MLPQRSKIAVEIVHQIESQRLEPHARQFKNADYAFDQGVLSRPLIELIEAH